MVNRRLSHLSRRSVLGAGLFVGSSMLLKACGQSQTSTPAPEGEEAAASAEGEGGAIGGSVSAVAYPGIWEEAHREVVASQVKTNQDIDATIVPMLANDQVAQLIAAPDNPPFDVCLLDEGPFRAAPREDILQPFPVDMSPSFANLFPDFQGGEEVWGPTVAVTAIGIGYNADRYESAPAAWEEFWNPENAGRIGLVTMNSSLGTAFMVEVAKRFGGSEADIEVAFERIQELLPNVAAVAPSPGALATLLQQGEVDIAPVYMNAVLSLQDAGLNMGWAIPEGGSVGIRATMSIVKNPQASVEAAAAYIDTVISAEAQNVLAASPYFFGPTNSEVQLSGPFEELFSTDPQDFISQLIYLDWDTINLNRPEWIERFNREVAV
ncbi:extracellular solute-binding protein [Vacuolonema iberomarrocanum]|uniref:extracellular solute-binding protein n=1 Tax=Vacuolonema iberomarrocanum TaxID=3454632 RepID=UPI0019DB4F20|nr:extracellular solute-binding protein [filamentous cyanobacterium LEGE 07170]